MARGPSKKVREGYALGQKNKEVHLHGGEDVINPYPESPAGWAYVAGEDDRYVPQWDVRVADRSRTGGILIRLIRRAVGMRAAGAEPPMSFAIRLVATAVTEFVTDLRYSELGRVLLLRFFLRATEEAKQSPWPVVVCNVADKAALRIQLRLKTCIGNGFQPFVTL